MPRRLPTELLALIASFASQKTLARLALASRTTYAVSVRPLYASITTNSLQQGPRTIQCLDTLTTNTHLARLVQSYHLNITLEKYNPRLPALVTNALRNMTGLTELSLQLGLAFSSTVLEHATFKLHKIVCVVKSSSKYSISRFLNSQPEIESLYLVCHQSALTSLSPTALPALKDVAAPLCILPKIVMERLHHITRISCLGTITNIRDFDIITVAFVCAPVQPKAPVELVLGLDLRGPQMSPEWLRLGVWTLGYAAPWIGLLRLEVHKGRVEPTLLQHSITSALQSYPSLHTLVIMSSPPPQFQTRAYIHPDPIHDVSQHIELLKSWRVSCPTLERVVFPVGVYTYVKELKKREDKLDTVCTGGDCSTCGALVEAGRVGLYPRSPASHFEASTQFKLVASCTF
ncbi:hypothetical protein FRC09_003702 [Ceratobasidium sp. 395]|nr:hypothetical protein FRC09_003702 [Ceratobasidium sp. 395]